MAPPLRRNQNIQGAPPSLRDKALPLAVHAERAPIPALAHSFQGARLPGGRPRQTLTCLPSRWRPSRSASCACIVYLNLGRSEAQQPHAVPTNGGSFLRAVLIDCMALLPKFAKLRLLLQSPARLFTAFCFRRAPAGRGDLANFPSRLTEGHNHHTTQPMQGRAEHLCDPAAPCPRSVGCMMLRIIILFGA